MRRSAVVACLAAAAAVALPGCSSQGPANVGGASGGPVTRAATAATPSPATAPAPATGPLGQPAGCPATGRPTKAWPDGVPADLPQPPTTEVTEVEQREDGLTVVTFTTATSIRESVVFLVQALPAAGYTLARGDAESTEADAPFVKGGLRGVMRMVAVEDCRTDWLLALTRGVPGGTPLLPVRPSASPLPFG